MATVVVITVEYTHGTSEPSRDKHNEHWTFERNKRKKGRKKEEKERKQNEVSRQENKRVRRRERLRVGALCGRSLGSSLTGVVCAHSRELSRVRAVRAAALRPEAT